MIGAKKLQGEGKKPSRGGAKFFLPPSEYASVNAIYSIYLFTLIVRSTINSYIACRECYILPGQPQGVLFSPVVCREYQNLYLILSIRSFSIDFKIILTVS